MINDFLEKNKLNRNVAIVTPQEIIHYYELVDRIIEKSGVIKLEESLFILIDNKLSDINFMVNLFALWYGGKTGVIIDSRMGIEEIENIKQISTIYLDTRTSKENIPLLVTTSGSMGNPKVVPISDISLSKKIKIIIHEYQLNSLTKELLLIPITNLSALVLQVFPTLFSGGTIFVYKDKYETDKVIDAICSKKIAFSGGTSSLLQVLFKNKEIDRNLLNSLVGFGVGGEMIDFNLLYELNEKIGRTVFYPMYGLTESLSAIAGKNNEVPKFKSVGKVYNGISVKVLDKNKISVQNEIGEIYISGDTIATEYCNNNNATEETFISGWMKTGDLGKIDHENYLYISGRCKNTIISGGITIYPEEIEEYLLKHKKIKHAVVKSKKHPVLHEVPIAEIILENSSLSSIDIKNYCLEGLALEKVPREIIILNEFKTIGFGKIRRNL